MLPAQKSETSIFSTRVVWVVVDSTELMITLNPLVAEGRTRLTFSRASTSRRFDKNSEHMHF